MKIFFVVLNKILTIQFVRILSIVSIILFSILKVSAQQIFTPPIVPASHPRLFILPSQIGEIKQKINRPEFQLMKLNVYSSSAPACLAFKYLMERDPQDGRNALNEAYNQLKTATQYKQNRPPFKSVFNAAVAFDYCYDLFSGGGVPSKRDFISELKRVCELGPGQGPWAPVTPDFPSIVGHSIEGVFYNQIFTGIAVYGDENILYDNAVDFLLKRIQPENNFWFSSHMHHQGSYIGTRQSHILLTALAFRTLSKGKNIFSNDLQYVPYQLAYYMRPDRQLMRLGDVSDDQGRYDYNSFVCRQTANYFNDPYLRWIADQNIFREYNKEIETCFFDLIYKPIDAKAIPLDNLPLTKYFPEPIGGDMVARTGWDFSGRYSPTALVHMRIGNYYFGNHQHKDFGTFQIYYKGNLTGDAGMYKGTNSQYGSEFHTNYQRATTAHNGLLIIDPNEKYSGGKLTNTRVDGGVRWPLNDDVQPNNLNMLLDSKNGYEYAKVIGREFGPDERTPEFSYISGDLTKGYNYGNGANPDKVKKVTRSMVTLNTGNPIYPCVFVVFDRIEATNPDFKKVFLMHSSKEASVIGNKATITQDNLLGGKLVSYTLLPESPKITTVKGYVIDGLEYDPGTKSNSAYEDLRWQLEVTPGQNNLNNEFFHVMSVMDANQEAPIPEKIISANLVGTKILDRIVMFDRKGSTLASAKFELDSDGEYNVLICDILPGKWLVEKNNGTLGTFEVSNSARSLYFKGTRGNYTITNLSPEENVVVKK